jgi:hypothetical protein
VWGGGGVAVSREKEGRKQGRKQGRSKRLLCIVCVWGLVSFMNVGFFSGFYLWCSQSGDHILDIKVRKHLNKKPNTESFYIFGYLPTYLLELIMKICLFEFDFKIFFPKIWQICVFFFQ